MKKDQIRFADYTVGELVNIRIAESEPPIKGVVIKTTKRSMRVQRPNGNIVYLSYL